MKVWFQMSLGILWRFQNLYKMPNTASRLSKSTMRRDLLYHLPRVLSSVSAHAHAKRYRREFLLTFISNPLTTLQAKPIPAVTIASQPLYVFSSNILSIYSVF